MEGGSVVAGQFDLATFIDHFGHYHGNVLPLLEGKVTTFLLM